MALLEILRGIQLRLFDQLMELAQNAVDVQNGANGEHKVHQQDDQQHRAHADRCPEGQRNDGSPHHRVHHPCCHHTKHAKHQRIAQADPAVDIKSVGGIVPPLGCKQFFQQIAGDVLDDTGHQHSAKKQ